MEANDAFVIIGRLFYENQVMQAALIGAKEEIDKLKSEKEELEKEGRIYIPSDQEEGGKS